MKKIIIAIDGFSSCGKSTLAKALAKALNYGFVDSGAMYRAVTLFLIENRISVQNIAAIEQALNEIQIRFQAGSTGNRTYLNGVDVEDKIRSMQVSELVSPVAAIPIVRRAMVRQQQEMGTEKGIVMDGRDIGTVVFPDAELKIFVTADPEVRAHRRFLELQQKGQEVALEEVRNNLSERDHIDSTRADSPLKQAEDALVLDNTDLNQEEQLQVALDWAQERIQAQVL
ncbi:MAG: (d)CMP kinase [Saprospiraceae bacterium]|nr:(d)CMP kinase [Saprospiraceae bacterium]